MNIYSLKDTKIGSYGRPFPGTHDVEATRSLEAIVNEVGNQVSNHPADFELWIIAEFDTDKGTFKPNLRNIVNAMALKTGEFQNEQKKSN